VGGGAVVGGMVGATVVGAAVVGAVVVCGTEVADPSAGCIDNGAVVVVPDALTSRWFDVDDFGLSAPPIIMIAKPEAVTIAPSLRVVILAKFTCPRTRPTTPKTNTTRPTKIRNPPTMAPRFGAGGHLPSSLIGWATSLVSQIGLTGQ